MLDLLEPNSNNPNNKIIVSGAEIYYLNDLDTRKNEVLSDLKRIKYHDHEDMVHRMGLTYPYNEIMDVLDIKYKSSSPTQYTLLASIYEIGDTSLMLNSLLLD